MALGEDGYTPALCYPCTGTGAEVVLSGSILRHPLTPVGEVSNA